MSNIRLAFVIPWFGFDIPGGAESHCREFVAHLNRRGYSTEVLTTCVRELASNWNEDFHRPGSSVENGITIRRFPVKRGNHKLFNPLNRRLLAGERLSDEEELQFMSESVNSEALVRYLVAHEAEYYYFFMPYPFGTSFAGIEAVAARSVLIPCLHDEAYAHMRVMRRMFERAMGVIFNSPAEEELGRRLYDLSRVRVGLLGEGVETDVSCRAVCRPVSEPFVLYVGRKDSTKNVDLLLSYFREYRQNRRRDVALVLAGPGSLPLPEGCVDLGFVDRERKHALMTQALVLCQPSVNESFSKVMMEAWLCRTPALVYDRCRVTADHARRSKGGLSFADYYEFEACVDFLLENPAVRAGMGETGRDYVLANYTWDIVLDRFETWFSSIREGGPLDERQSGKTAYPR